MRDKTRQRQRVWIKPVSFGNLRDKVANACLKMLRSAGMSRTRRAALATEARRDIRGRESERGLVIRHSRYRICRGNSKTVPKFALHTHTHTHEGYMNASLTCILLNLSVANLRIVHCHLRDHVRTRTHWAILTGAGITRNAKNTRIVSWKMRASSLLPFPS